MKKPILPSDRLTGEDFVYEFHEQAAILKFQIFHAEPAIFLTCTNIFPHHKTLRAMADFIFGPKECAMTPVNRLNDFFRDAHSGHVVKRDGAEHSS